MANITRRNFLKGAAAGAAGVAAMGIVSASAAQAASEEYLTADSLNKKWAFEVPPAAITDAEIKETVQAEVIVVGAGTAGLCTAASAAQSGLKTVLISASSTPTARGGSNHASYSKVMAREGYEPQDIETIYLDELNANSRKVDQRQWYRFANKSPEAMDWFIDIMEGEGYEVGLETGNTDADEHSPTFQPVGVHCVMNEEYPGTGTGQPLVVLALEKTFLAAGGTVFYKNVAKQLVRGGVPNGTEGRVDAVIAKNEAGEYIKYVGTKAVVMATGDFSADKDMMARYAPDTIHMFSQFAEEDGFDYDFGVKLGGLYRGDGQKMGLWVGAAWQRVFPNCAMIQGTRVCTNMPMGSHRGLIVNKLGERCGNEDCNAALNIWTVQKQPDEKMYAIWGSDYAYSIDWHGRRDRRGDPARDPQAVLTEWEDSVADEAFVKGSTVEEVIEKLDLPASTVDTVNRYQEMVDKGHDDDFHKKAAYLQPISGDCFYGADLGSYRSYSIMGGLRTNVDMQVCEADDTPIPGLYNVGTMSGDFFANIYNFRLSGINLGQCVCFGYLTGKYIADNE